MNKIFLKLTPREIVFTIFSVFCLALAFISFSVVNSNNSKIEKLLAVAEKASKATVSLPLEQENSDDDDSELTNTDSENEKISASWNEETKTFESPEGKLVIDKIETVKGYKDKPVLKVSFSITNKSSEEKGVQLLFSSLVDIKQRNENTSNSLSYGSLTSSENNHLQDRLNAGGTISGFYPLELENETDPVIFDFQYDYTSLYEWKYTLK
ncbi:DUF5067 domain-containing protein [Streptococcus acidominimus]|uniref:DUF5067 domain-containing protein n=1 Tax=Streptococcus acidominimus TaxID=1326 RepID=A0A1Q8ECV2_STRAI|nr:DUF5067 domain-containing protein [Streptococcus acidominimus]OLF49620.1 hypothetical protein BU200_06345 [Streptococcus acidominimus]SUN08222.1 Uncharacterised protein [Streptococcus acidominimus]